MKRFDDYDPFAWVYSHHWGGDFHDRIMPVLENAVLHRLPPAAEVLDLCCGDGRLTERLEKRGFVTTGLEGSAEMLAFARKRCPRVHFIHADARDFDLPAQFDAVVATFDSLNHVMLTRDLMRVFRKVRQCLKPGGAFVFDLNTERVYREASRTPATVVTESVVSIARGDFDAGSRTAICDVTVMRLLNGRWQRSDFRLLQKCHPRLTVVKTLRSSGFSVSVHDASSLGMQGHFAAGREVYVAELPVDPAGVIVQS